MSDCNSPTIKLGDLYLIPVPLGHVAPEYTLPADVINRVHALTHFVAEHAKSARAFLKAAGTPHPLPSIQIQELNEHTRASQLPELIAPLLAGNDVGLISEAGCPAVADPGANLVALAHAKNVRVLPLVGPSSLLLALMASGLGGQQFAFHGYLPVSQGEREKQIRRLEKNSREFQQTEIFIETPYRNGNLFDSLLKTCQPSTQLCIASDLTLATEFVRTQSILNWKRSPPPDLDRRPSVFLLRSP